MTSPTQAGPPAPIHRRLAGVLAATALATAPAALLGAPAAHATASETASETAPETGSAAAAVLRADLDIALLGKTAQIPLHTSLNEVSAPSDAEGISDRNSLDVTLDGVNAGQPLSLLTAQTARAEASVDEERAVARARLENVLLNVPGLPQLPLLELGTVTSTASCEAGGTPEARSTVAGPVKILGLSRHVTAGGPPAKLPVPGVGEVSLTFSQTATTERSATTSALKLEVDVDPLKLGVAKVHGSVTVVEASCESPAARPTGGENGGPSAGPAAEVDTQTGGEDLAETGGGSATPVVAGAAVVLLGAGAGALALGRRRARG
ncbi:SCO1860 family LAETG-anchored protein [Streptomyces polyrhachis]|uniref:SCO1860 family LAETG-anchored protein n=1 Tax=Streptomyces polyrhachis TaxID=1282885 RepID=A0ABW2GIC0_9ACTN